MQAIARAGRDSGRVPRPRNIPPCHLYAYSVHQRYSSKLIVALNPPQGDAKQCGGSERIRRSKCHMMKMMLAWMTCILIHTRSVYNNVDIERFRHYIPHFDVGALSQQHEPADI